MLDYLTNHWHGRQSLWKSCWINLIVLGFVVLLFLRRGLPWAVDRWPSSTVYLIMLGGLVATPFVVWQIRGVLRACRLELQGTAAAGDSLLIQSLVLGYCLLLSFSLFDLTRFTLSVPADSAPASARQLVFPYDAVPGSILIKGTIDFGLTASLEKKLREEKDIRQLVLDSDGGVISEARGIMRLVREYGLATHVSSKCFSACTLVFISGKSRTIAMQGRLGFHQYSLDSTGYNPGVNPAEQQVLDSTMFASQGISQWFIDRAYREPHSGLWIPTNDELLAAGVVTRVES